MPWVLAGSTSTTSCSQRQTAGRSILRGLKLFGDGVLSGSPSGKLAAGPSSATVQVTETVTNLNGKRKVKTKTTVQATIPPTIN